MSEHKKILKLIENVDPENGEVLRDIECYADCFIHDYVFWECRREHKDSYDFSAYWCKGANTKRVTAPRYTRSRDALKAIRPEGVYIFQSPYSDKTWICFSNFWDDEDRDDFESPKLPTEELAELHAIIQAVAYERGLIEEEEKRD